MMIIDLCSKCYYLGIKFVMLLVDRSVMNEVTRMFLCIPNGLSVKLSLKWYSYSNIGEKYYTCYGFNLKFENNSSLKLLWILYENSKNPIKKNITNT